MAVSMVRDVKDSKEKLAVISSDSLPFRTTRCITHVRLVPGYHGKFPVMSTHDDHG